MPSLQRISKMTRWRAVSLIAVHLLAALHFLQWKLNGWTLAPVEPSEMFDTLHLGIITVGFLFMVTLLVATAIAGRFFCSWGCHILALQDLSAWLLRRFRIPAQPIRSRTLVWVPPLAVVYLFVWPQVERLLAGKPLPKLHVVTDPEGWTSFITTDLLRSFPGLGMTLFTFAVCGFAIVYFLGSRSFCSYACPYGAMFAVADRVAPLRIVAGDGPCTKCGACIATCPSNVRVIDEVDQFGTVVNSNCMKDLDCVSVCPTGAIKYGIATPPAARSWWKPPGLKKTYDFTFTEDMLMAGTFIVVLPIFRGLYDAISFLLALALAAIVAYATVVAMRLFRSERVVMGNLQLKHGGRWTTEGKWVAVTLGLLAVFVLHSGWVQFHTHTGRWAIANSTAAAGHGGSPSESYVAGKDPAPPPNILRAIHHYEQAARWGLVRPRGLQLQLAALYEKGGEYAAARDMYSALLAEDANDYASRLRLAWTWARDGRPELARRQAEVVLASINKGTSSPATELHEQRISAAAHYLLGDLEAHDGNRAAAMEQFQTAIQIHPRNAEAHVALGSLQATAGKLDEALDHFHVAVELGPDSAAAHNNLAAVLVELDRKEEALAHFRRSIELLPENPATYVSTGTLLLDLGQTREAEQMFKKALNRQADYAEARVGLEQIRLQKAAESKGERLKVPKRLPDGR